MKLRQVLFVTAIASFFLLGTEVQAKSSQAMVSVRAISTPKIQLRKGEGTAYIFYNVCNNRSKAFKGIQVQSIRGLHFQPATFDLQSRQCRMLKVMINPALISREGVHGGPVLQLAQGNKEALEAGFWNVQPEEEQAMSVSNEESIPMIFLPVINNILLPSSERNPDNPNQSKYPAYALLNNPSSYSISNLTRFSMTGFSINDTKGNCHTNKLGAYETCLLAIDSTSSGSFNGALEILGTYSSGFAAGAALMQASDLKVITTSPADLSSLHMTANTPLVITVTGANDADIFIGIELLIKITSYTTTCSSDICDITLETDSTETVSPIDFYIQDVSDAGSSIALAGKLSLN
ncbi:MAG: hypothetical protein K0U37_06880 [Gammaproteobacteria bacterium]|nr:hypothetical protein [Gammaproteobacteria bacterium]